MFLVPLASIRRRLHFIGDHIFILTFTATDKEFVQVVLHFKGQFDQLGRGLCVALEVV